MQVIFLQDVPRVGKKYDIKKVNDGYAINFLFPKKLAILANIKSIAELERHKKEILIEKKLQMNILEKNLEEIKNKTIIIKVKTDEKGHLFSTIHKKMIVEVMKKECNVQIDEKFIALKEQIKKVGEFQIPIKIEGKESSFKLVVEKNKF